MIIVAAATALLFHRIQVIRLPQELQPAAIDSINALTQACFTYTQSNEDRLVEPAVRTFIDLKWTDLKLPNACSNKENKHFLIKKMADFLKESQAPADWNEQVCQNIISNFAERLKIAFKRIKKDCIQASFRAAFQLSPNTNAPESIKIIGKETHERGKNVYLVEFGRRKIVYKPRSMLPEKLVCSRTFSLFQQVGLATYTVYTREDKLLGEKYGYCDFLKYNEEGCTFRGVGQLAEYYTKIAHIEGFAQALQLTDLHAENVLIKDQNPYLIDLEAILSPQYCCSTLV